MSISETCVAQDQTFWAAAVKERQRENSKEKKEGKEEGEGYMKTNL